MAKYLSYKANGDEKSFFKLHSSDASKNWWNAREVNLNFITISDSDYNKLKISHPYEINSSNEIEFSVLDENSPAVDLTKENVKIGLDKHIEQMKKHLAQHSTPLISQSDIDTLNSVNLDTITWPASSTVNNWVEVCENNSITIDFIYEV